jgi:hypothetical protein
MVVSTTPRSPMTTNHPEPDAHRYSIRVRGRLDPRWAAWFDGHTLTADADGTTIIETAPLDQAALHGLLRQVGDAGLALVAVARTDGSAQRAVEDGR